MDNGRFGTVGRFGTKYLKSTIILTFISKIMFQQLCWFLSSEAMLGFVDEYKDPRDNITTYITLM